MRSGFGKWITVKKNNLPPAQSWAWNEAEKAFQVRNLGNTREKV